MFYRIAALIYKEILAVWRDKKSRTVLIIPPMVQLFVFSFAATLDVKNVHIGVINKDQGKASYELIERFRGSPVFTRLTPIESESEVPHFLDNQKGIMVVSIDDQFSRKIALEEKAPVQLLLDARKSNTAQIVAGYANTIIDQYDKEVAKLNSFPLDNTEIISRNWFNPNLIYYWFNVPSLSGLLTMLVGLLITALSVAREKELGTFDQLLVSPMTPIEIMLGKTIPALIIGLIEGSFIIFCGVFVFQIPFNGNILYLFFGMTVFISSIVGIGLFISSLCSTQQQAILGTYVFMSPSVLLSGFATPIENMPSWMQYITYLNPLKYYLIIAKGVFLKDMPFHDVFHYSWPLLLIAGFNLTLATLFFRRKLS